MYKILSLIFKRDCTCHYKSVVGRYSSVADQSAALDEDLANRLETVSLVGFSKHSGFEVLSASVKFADRITRIDTTKVQPLITVLENWYETFFLNYFCSSPT